jgi:para-aminobenzoate synthetase component I
LRLKGAAYPGRPFACARQEAPIESRAVKKKPELLTRKLGPGPRPVEVLDALEGREGVFLLESALRPGRFARWSLLGFDPFMTLSAKGRMTWTREENRRSDLEGTAFNELGRLLERFALTPAAPDDELPEFRCGAVGYFGYELGRLIERLPGRVPDDLKLPDMHIGFYDRSLAYDHDNDQWWASATNINNANPADILEELARLLTRTQPETFSRRSQPGEGGRNPKPLAAEANQAKEAGTESFAASETLRSNFTATEYAAAVSRVIEYIAAGDIFQASFTQRFEAEWPSGGVSLYRRLREVNPAPFAAYYDFGAGQVVSASPELFLHVSGRQVTTRPIKGTRPRGENQEQDRHLADELMASPKDRAELTMIVDLERNDLGRVCSYDSVRVSEHLALESYPTVHHLVSTVVGELHTGRTLAELLKASFPGGSITGAPKVRAMEIIDELERSARGVYTGAMGFIDFDGNAELNLPIRTFTVTNGRAYFGVGGGVVADSSPEGEYQESLDKAKGLIAALERGAKDEAGE